MIDYKTTFEATKNVFANVEFGHGENANLHATFTDVGVPVVLSGYTARAIYQPQSKWNTSDFYECPCEIDGNEVIVHWSHVQDNGDRLVKMWVRLQKGDEVSYPALYKLALFATPGFNPATLEPIPETIDFSQYTLLNAPWLLSSDFNMWKNNVYSLLQGRVTYLEQNMGVCLSYDGTNGENLKPVLHANPNALVSWDADGLELVPTGAIFTRILDATSYAIYATYDPNAMVMATFMVSGEDELEPGDFVINENQIATPTYVNNQITAAVGDINTILDSINGEVI